MSTFFCFFSESVEPSEVTVSYSLLYGLVAYCATITIILVVAVWLSYCGFRLPGTGNYLGTSTATSSRTNYRSRFFNRTKESPAALDGVQALPAPDGGQALQAPDHLPALQFAPSSNPFNQQLFLPTNPFTTGRVEPTLEDILNISKR